MTLGIRAQLTKRPNVPKASGTKSNANPSSKQYMSPKVKNSGGSGSPKPFSSKVVALCK